ncbi:MAG: hypothetical protein ACJAR8_000948 [Bacteroidia bacterium]|jgi:hypothetical protein
MDITAILSGDIINSRSVDASLWIKTLKKALNTFGKSTKTWEIYRGDSFQLEVDATTALQAAYYIKAEIKQHKELDVRIAIGIGDKTYASSKITESNGTAFENSGDCFNTLKNTLEVKSPWPEIDHTFNIAISLGLLTADSWSPTNAFIFKTALEHPDMSQHDLAKKIKKSQSNISAGLKRSGYQELVKLIHHFEHQILEKC